MNTSGRLWAQADERLRVSGGYNQVRPHLCTREKDDRGGEVLRLNGCAPIFGIACSRNLHALCAMPESPKLPDQYHRSRLTTLVASTALFIVSIQTVDDLSKILPFGLHIQQRYQSFFIIALLIYALISLISLHLVFDDEVRGYLKKRQSEEQLADIGALSTRARQVLSDFEERSSETIRALSQISLEDIMVRASSEIHPEALQGLVKKAFADLPVERLSDKAMRLESLAESGRTDLGDEFRDTLRAISGMVGDVAYWHDHIASSLMERDANGAWNRQTLAKFIEDFSWGFNNSSSNLYKLSADLSVYVDEIKKGSMVRRVEYQIIGVWMPTALFIVAALHGLGAIFGGIAHSLPYCVMIVLEYIR